MYNKEYYNDRRESFEIIYENMLSGENAALASVLEAERMQEENDERAFAANEGLDRYTAIAESMNIESVADFERYLASCIGGRMLAGVATLRRDPEAFFVPSSAIVESKHELAIRVPDKTEGRVLVKQKRKNKYTWTPEDGFEKQTSLVCTPMTKSEIKRKTLFNKIFANKENVVVKDKKFPVYPIISVLLCMVLFILPVFLTILNNEVAVENKEYDSYIRELKGEIGSLENQLAIKNDMEKIDTLARNEYGMIEIELSDVRLMGSSDEGMVLEARETEENPNIFVALLNAIGVLGE